MSMARRMRRAAMQGKRPEDITIKVGSRGHAPVYAPCDYTAMFTPAIMSKSNSHGEERKG